MPNGFGTADILQLMQGGSPQEEPIVDPRIMGLQQDPFADPVFDEPGSVIQTPVDTPNPQILEQIIPQAQPDPMALQQEIMQQAGALQPQPQLQPQLQQPVQEQPQMTFESVDEEFKAEGKRLRNAIDQLIKEQGFNKDTKEAIDFFKERHKNDVGLRKDQMFGTEITKGALTDIIKNRRAMADSMRTLDRLALSMPKNANTIFDQLERDAQGVWRAVSGRALTKEQGELVRWMQMKDRFTQAYLKAISGATVSDNEFARVAGSLLGDDKTDMSTVRQLLSGLRSMGREDLELYNQIEKRRRSVDLGDVWRSQNLPRAEAATQNLADIIAEAQQPGKTTEPLGISSLGRRAMEKIESALGVPQGGTLQPTQGQTTKSRRDRIKEIQEQLRQ